MSDPLFPTAALLPLSEPGGVQMAIAHTPGSLRPFVATLGVPHRLGDKKHDTSATKTVTRKNEPTMKDGTSVTDSFVETHVDT